MTTKICPRCASSEFDDESVWLWNARFYCSEKCCREAANR